ncbi:MAG: hypothetical protein F6K30_24435 [Cyanothece sp. SIO2G6]|nr:hypothetical protein [Cyanothece sp. SIO2G6]
MATLSHSDFDLGGDHSNDQVPTTGPPQQKRDFFAPLRHWFNQINPRSSRQAHLICRLIPPTCPFARTIKFFGYTILDIPPLCKLNPLYEEFIALRFRALTYLADTCKEDISQYC